MSAVISFDVTVFRAQFPAFKDPTTYPTALIEMFWGQATCYVSDQNCGSLQGKCRGLAINSMTAHLMALNDLINCGQTPGQITSSTIDKVSVTLTPPPSANQWQYWLELTPYGNQLFALLQAKSVGGFYIGGLPETGAFRKVGGIF